jgi:hypothetical protein
MGNKNFVRRTQQPSRRARRARLQRVVASERDRDSLSHNRIGGTMLDATGRVLEPQTDELYLEVRDRARTKYGWGDGLPLEFRLVNALGKV